MAMSPFPLDIVSIVVLFGIIYVAVFKASLQYSYRHDRMLKFGCSRKWSGSKTDFQSAIRFEKIVAVF
jgi:hypothetical protein